MASLGHLAVGYWAARTLDSGDDGLAGRRLVSFLALSALPDADVIAFVLRIPYGAAFGHRGATHSVAFALAAGALGAALAGWLGLAPRRAFAWSALVVLLHALADALTDGGLGVALLWPWSEARWFAPWRPMPVAPIGLRMLSGRGLAAVVGELAFFAPFLVMGLRSARRSRRGARAGTGGDAASRLRHGR